MRNVKVLACLWMLAWTLSAQTDRSEITGTIVDPTGAVVNDAVIEALQSGTGTVFRGGTSATGNYVISVPRGIYDLMVAAPGFQTAVRRQLEVPVATRVRQDVELAVGAAAQSIEISAQAPLIRTDNGEISHILSSRRLNQLPVVTLGTLDSGFGNLRNPLAALNLLPGTSFQNDEILRVNGLPSNSHTVRVEGQDATNGLWRRDNQITQIGLDAIEEVSVQTSSFAAEFGQAAGGYFNYTMKSGGNDFHGSAFLYFTNEALNAGMPFTDDGNGRHTKGEQRRYSPGASIGGPVLLPGYDGHDRTFFFFNTEHFQESQTKPSQVDTVPTEALRRGDFAAVMTPFPAGRDAAGRTVFGNQIFDPATATFTENGAPIRLPFDGNQIPLARMDPVALAIQDLLPLPNQGGGFRSNYLVPEYEDSRVTQNYSIKLDHSLTGSAKISGVWSTIGRDQRLQSGYDDLPFNTATVSKHRSHTVRVNYDQSLTPTLLLHLGAGLLHTSNPESPVTSFDPAQLGLEGFYTDAFPLVSGFLSGALGRGGIEGFGIGVIPFSDRDIRDVKSTQNASLTWVRNNHTIKIGAEAVVEGFPVESRSRSNGNFLFSPQQTATPSEQGQGWVFTSGHGYASFLLGLTSSFAVSPPTQTRLGNHSLAFFIQDNWKATRRLTVDYGLRYDFSTYLREQYGRWPSFSTDTLNPTVGLPGAVIYEGNAPGRCQCNFGRNYPYAFGPRLGMAFQVDERTVLRGGAGLVYGTASNNANLSTQAPDFLSVNASGFAEAATQLSQGNLYRDGNPYGLPAATWPDFNPGRYPTPTQDGLTPQSPPIAIDPGIGRPPRILQWSVGMQRQIASNLVLEAAYVGNRGVWFTAPALSTVHYNALQPETLQSNYGLDIRDANDRALLTLPISSPAAAAAGFSTPAYPGMPSMANVNQQLRPFPQFNGIQPYLGPPLGRTWYDALQVKLTHRYQNGLDVQAAFTYQKELTLGVNSDTTYLTPGRVIINDVFNRDQNKQLSAFSRPLQFVVAFSYTTQDWFANRWLSRAARNWTLAGVLRYQSGELLPTPGSNNDLMQQLARGPSNNLALWGGGRTTWNRVPGADLFLTDPNGDFDPQKQLAFNPDAWVDAAPGEFGAGAGYYNDFRWQRQPSESLSLARTFQFTEGTSLMIRAEFQNVFNRLFYTAPEIRGLITNTTPATPASGEDRLLGGWGFSGWLGGGRARPRSGQLVLRLTF